jgi:sterol desaturase/sphingolipid hydroxylase (fatty acid hydroxylase superfamily)
MASIAVVVVLAIAAEALVALYRGRAVYTWPETELSLGLFAGWFAVALVWGYVFYPAVNIHQPRLFAAPRGLLGIVLLILAGDFLYYWSHRLGHFLRWLWASHVVHHTSERLNFLASLRQGWTDPLSGLWLFWLPLGLLGFPSAAWNEYFVALLLWQLWIHNEWCGRVGPLEWIFVTPSHHRVHHSLQPEHNDRNFGGIFIVWDRLFRTFTDEGSARLTRFGLAEFDGRTAAPVATAFMEWRAILSDFLSRKNFAGRIATLVRRSDPRV